MGYYLGSSFSFTWNDDQINSIRIGPKTNVKLYENVSFSGTTWIFTNYNDSDIKPETYLLIEIAQSRLNQF